MKFGAAAHLPDPGGQAPEPLMPNAGGIRDSST